MAENENNARKQESDARAMVTILWYAFLFFGGVLFLYYAGFLGDNSDAPGLRDSSQNISVSASPKPRTSTSVNTVPSPARDAPTFGGYDCTYDCSGHEAGYTWADENQICDTDYSYGNSESFNEGVREWAQENCFSDEYSEGGY